MTETKEVTPKDVVGVEKSKRKYTRKAKKGKPGRPKGSGAKQAMVGRPKGKPGRPKGSGAGRPKGSKGLIGLVAKQIKAALKSQKADTKALVKSLVAKEFKKALKEAFR